MHLSGGESEVEGVVQYCGLDAVRVFSVQFSVKCAVCYVQCAVFNVQCTVFSVKCAVCSVQCTLYAVIPCGERRKL